LKKYKKVQVWIARNYPGKTPQVLLFEVIQERGGGWHPVTGSVEKGEALFDAAKRETEEETGLTASDSQWKDLNFSYSFEGRWGKAEEHAFGVIFPEMKAKIKLDPKEHLSCKWVGVDQAMKILSFESQKRALELFSCYLD